MKLWHITRYIKEEFFIEAETRKDALDYMWEQGDPPKVTCTKQTCKLDKVTTRRINEI